jgi:hypothetical protein
MFRHYCVILRELVINPLPSYTSISNAAVGNTVYNKLLNQNRNIKVTIIFLVTWLLSQNFKQQNGIILKSMEFIIIIIIIIIDIMLISVHISYKNILMLTYIIKTNLLSFCYSIIFRPSKGHFRKYDWYIFTAGSTICVTDAKYWKTKCIYK